MNAFQRSQIVAVVVGDVLGGLLYSKLPEEIPPAWAISSLGTVWFGRPMVAFLLPTAAAMTYGLGTSFGSTITSTRARFPAWCSWMRHMRMPARFKACLTGIGQRSLAH